ncbi:MAG: efflux RND transporter periplasmic adaptor subunit [Anaerolineae bacterium]|nr:efflux RND transporter periplasmic adaptor subunit [Anaerolineae bacterium]
MAVSILVLSACSPKAEPAAAMALPQAPQELIVEGRLMPVNSLDQSFSIPGQVAEVLVKDGETVSVGQALARLHNSPETELALARAKQEALLARQSLDNLSAGADVALAQARLAVLDARDEQETAQNRFDANDSEENQARLDLANATLKQAEDLLAMLETGAGIDPDLKSAAEARLASAGAALNSAQAAMDALELTATLAGQVVDLNLQAGERVAAGQPVMTVADASQWIVETDNLTEIDVVNVKVGQKAKITLDALPTLTLDAEVTHVTARYAEKRGDITYTVTLVLSQTDPMLRWGMTAAVAFLP